MEDVLYNLRHDDAGAARRPGTTLVVPATDAGAGSTTFSPMRSPSDAVPRCACVPRPRQWPLRAQGRPAAGGDVLTVPPTDAAPDLPADATVAVLRETADVLVLDKPAGLLTVEERARAATASLPRGSLPASPSARRVGAPRRVRARAPSRHRYVGLLLAARTPAAYGRCARSSASTP